MHFSIENMSDIRLFYMLDYKDKLDNQLIAYLKWRTHVYLCWVHEIFLHRNKAHLKYYSIFLSSCNHFGSKFGTTNIMNKSVVILWRKTYEYEWNYFYDLQNVISIEMNVDCKNEIVKNVIYFILKNHLPGIMKCIFPLCHVGWQI